MNAVGEAVSGLVGPVAWQPNGRHIYAVHDNAEETKVGLYERNGLSHGEFSLRTKGDLPRMVPLRMQQSRHQIYFPLVSIQCQILHRLGFKYKFSSLLGLACSSHAWEQNMRSNRAQNFGRSL